MECSWGVAEVDSCLFPDAPLLPREAPDLVLANILCLIADIEGPHCVPVHEVPEGKAVVVEVLELLRLDDGHVALTTWGASLDVQEVALKERWKL
ncbi:hypothetical protein DPMN_011728 [Dreissena polymorpha]|uniref:Uncharacterized protein n=1 Tax=Dreissena polymorpha TaxID=45954 RepID=A0A9D4N5P5_DREPO|nr:hypothetical protein DPMN_011728 [Dreissena polymorpha]